MRGAHSGWEDVVRGRFFTAEDDTASFRSFPTPVLAWWTFLW
jgi:hypothetical protein